MSTAASDVYEIVLEETAGKQKWFRTAIALVVGVFTMGSGITNPGGMILSVRRKDNGDEFFRHIEDMGDDEGHLLDGIQQDLATMTLTDFEARWG